MQCSMCDGKINIFNSKKVSDGRICRNCYNEIPPLLYKRVRNSSNESIKHIANRAKDCRERFFKTSSYGNLHLDEMHGLFAVDKRIDASGRPTNSNVFSVYDLEDVNISCKIVNTKSNVFADVFLTFRLVDVAEPVKAVIKRKAVCAYRQVDNSHIECVEPKELTFFRSVFSNTLSGAFEKVRDMLVGKTLHDFELEKACALLMLDPDYTEADLKRARRLMMKVYHPDVSEDDTSKEAQIINAAYDLCKFELEKKTKS